MFLIEKIKKNRVIQIVTVILAFCSIIYELVFSQILSIIFGSSVLMYSLTIGIFLFSMGLGSILYEKLKEKEGQQIEKIFLKIEILLSVIGILGIPFILFVNSFSDSFTNNIFNNYWILMIISFFPVILIGLLSGFEIPVLFDLDKKNSFSKILGVDYFGSLLGTVLYSLFFYPILGLFGTIILITSLNIFTALFYLFYHYHILNDKNNRYSGKMKKIFLVILTLITLYTFLFCYSGKINQYFEKKYWGNKITEFYNQYTTKDSKLVAKINNIERTKYQTIIQYDIFTERKDPRNGKPFWSDKCLNLDTHLQLCDSWYESYNQGLIDVPISFFKKKKKIKVLLLGGGDYIPAWGFKQFNDRIKKIDMVDLDPDFRDFAKKKLVKYNKEAWKYQKINLYSQDAFTFLKGNKEKYDLILFDLPGAKSEKMLPLYSVEMFQFIKSALKKKGIFVKWTYPENPYTKHYRVVNNTLLKAGFKRKLEYQVYNQKTDGYDEYFTILSLDKKNKIWDKFKKNKENKEWSDFMNRFNQKMNFSENLLKEYKDKIDKGKYRVSSVFRPNYNLVIKNRLNNNKKLK